MRWRTGGWISLIPLIFVIGLLCILGSSLGLNPKELPSPLINSVVPKTLFSNNRFKPLPAVIHFFSDEDEKMMVKKITRKWPIPFYGVRYKIDEGKAVFSPPDSPYEWVISDEGNIGIELGVASTPEYYILDAAQIIRYKHSGPLSEAVFEKTFLPILSTLQVLPSPTPLKSTFMLNGLKSTDPLKIYEKLIRELRCVTCQNQTLVDSSAPVAVSMRAFIYLKLHEGATEAKIKDFLVQRYGDYVLYNPPIKKETSLLWVGPFVLLLMGISMGIGLMRPRKIQ